MGDRTAFQANQAELPAEILLWRKRQCHQDTNLGDIDCELASDGDAEAAGTSLELLRTGNNGQNSADVYVDFYSLFNNPEKDWENMAVFDKISPHQLTLF